MKNGFLLFLATSILAIGCGPSKPIKASELVGTYAYKWDESPKPENFEELILRADGTYTLSRTGQAKEYGQWRFFANSPNELALGTSGYAVKRSGQTIRIIDNPDIDAWFEKTSDVPRQE
jgi:hypothetical protein